MTPVASSSRVQSYRFDGFTFDVVRGALLGQDGAEVPLRPKAFALLRHFVENAGRLIGREEIFKVIWPGVLVTEDSITLCIRQLRRALDDDGHHLLRTVPRRGYIFSASVSRVEAADPDPATAARAKEPHSSRGAEATRSEGRAVLAVLPFGNMTGDPGQEYFADGITEDLTTALSHLRWFSVISRNSAFTYKGCSVDIRRVGRELHAGYVLEGSVRRAGRHLRIYAQLCEAESGRQVWAKRFDSSTQDIFVLQDHVVEAVAGAIEPSLQRAEADRIRARPTSNFGAYDLYLGALHLRWQGTRAACGEAVALLRRAVALDHDFSAAWGMLADLAGYRISQGWAAQEDAAADEALAGARRLAEAGNADNPSALAWAAYALSFLGKDYAAGLATAQHALALAPRSSQVLFCSGWCHLYAGKWRVAITLIEDAMRLSPLDPLILTFHVALSAAHFAGSQYEQAADNARMALRAHRYLVPRRLLAASLAWLGRLEEAGSVVADIRDISPSETIRSVADKSAYGGDSRARFLEGLRKAGLPE